LGRRTGFFVSAVSMLFPSVFRYNGPMRRGSRLVDLLVVFLVVACGAALLYARLPTPTPPSSPQPVAKPSPVVLTPGKGAGLAAEVMRIPRAVIEVQKDVVEVFAPRGVERVEMVPAAESDATTKNEIKN